MAGYIPWPLYPGKKLQVDIGQVAGWVREFSGCFEENIIYMLPLQGVESRLF
jgi:hypothetical protein